MMKDFLKLLSSLFKSKPNFSEVTKFQVIGLLSQRVNFEIIFLEEPNENYKNLLSKDAILSRLLEVGRLEIDTNKLLDSFKQAGQRPIDAPVMLLCNTGKKSAQISTKVAKLGYKNLYTLNRGFSEFGD